MAMVKKCINGLMLWGVIIATLFTVIYVIGGDLLMDLLSDDKGVKHIADEYMMWVITVPFAGFLAFTWDGIYIGALATRQMLLSMFTATVVFFSVYFISFPSMHNHGLWLAFICYLLTRGIILSLFRKNITR